MTEFQRPYSPSAPHYVLLPAPPEPGEALGGSR